jgi:hypothetical protein
LCQRLKWEPSALLWKSAGHVMCPLSALIMSKILGGRPRPRANSNFTRFIVASRKLWLIAKYLPAKLSACVCLCLSSLSLSGCPVGNKTRAALKMSGHKVQGGVFNSTQRRTRREKITQTHPFCDEFMSLLVKIDRLV